MTIRPRRLRVTPDRLTTLTADVRWFALGLTLGSCLFLVVFSVTGGGDAATGIFAMLAMLSSAIWVLIGHAAYPPATPRRRVRFPDK